VTNASSIASSASSSSGAAAIRRALAADSCSPPHTTAIYSDSPVSSLWFGPTISYSPISSLTGRSVHGRSVCFALLIAHRPFPAGYTAHCTATRAHAWASEDLSEHRHVRRQRPGRPRADPRPGPPGLLGLVRQDLGIQRADLLIRPGRRRSLRPARYGVPRFVVHIVPAVAEGVSVRLQRVLGVVRIARQVLELLETRPVPRRVDEDEVGVIVGPARADALPLQVVP